MVLYRGGTFDLSSLEGDSMMERGNLSRRGFMKHSVAALTAAGLPLWYAQQVHGADEAAKAANKAVGANDKLQFGVIGVGPQPRRSNHLYGEAKQHKNVTFKGVCDVDARHLKYAEKQYKGDGYEVTGYDDFRRLNDNKEIDTVIIAVPDQWHALIAIDALRKGKDVYCEKPLTLTIEEAQALKKVVKETGKVLQTGSQQRDEFGGKFRLAAEVVRSGRLGKIQTIECRIGGNPTSGKIKEAPIPEGLNWDFWLGPTAKVPYLKDGAKTNCHYEFRWFYEYSGGKMTDWGAHHLDIAQWMLDKDGSGPTQIEVLDAAKPYDGIDGYNCHPTFKVQYTYDNGVKVIAMDGRGTKVDEMYEANGDRKGLSANDNGVLVIGEKGKVYVGRGRISASDPKFLTDPIELDKPLYPSRPSSHMGNFIDCIKTREEPICNVTVGAGSVMVCQLGVIALRTGKKFTWDPAKGEFTGENAELGNKMKSREMRAPWTLDV